MSSDTVCAIGAEQVPYFRTPEFSAVMFENERLVKKFAKADETSVGVLYDIKLISVCRRFRQEY